HEDVDLDDAARRYGRQRQEPEALDVLIVARPGNPWRETGALDGPPDERQLRHPAGHGGDAEPEGDIGGVFDRQHRQGDEDGDVDDVQEHRGEGGGEEFTQAVEDGAIGGHQTHAGQVGEHDAREKDGELELFRIVHEAGDEYQHDLAHEDFGQDRDDDDGGHQPAHDAAGEPFGLVGAFGFERAREHGHEGGVEG